jgi:hypothetical protein
VEKIILKNTKVAAAGTGMRNVPKEAIIGEIDLKIHKFNNRPKPVDKKNILIFPIFSEFGCEILSVIYCLPIFLKRFTGKYTIVVGWHGREYLYKHLVDEFWEVSEKSMHLREYCRAFHHESKNLKNLENNLSSEGVVIPIGNLSNIAIFPKIKVCGDCKENIEIINDFQVCGNCKKAYHPIGLFEDIKEAKSKSVWLPVPSEDKMKWARDHLPPNAVGISARSRKTWGRNFPPLFYEQLIYLLEDRGYNPVWIGEPATILPCPIPRIMDYSRMKEASDLEQTLALTKCLRMTIQYYTASTRLASLMETPFIIFESPDQICGRGQEGMRLNLLTRGDKKLILCEYLDAVENQWELLKLTERAIVSVEKKDFSTEIGMVADEKYIKFLMESANDRIS